MKSTLVIKLSLKSFENICYLHEIMIFPLTQSKNPEIRIDLLFKKNSLREIVPRKITNKMAKYVAQISGWFSLNRPLF